MSAVILTYHRINTEKPGSDWWSTSVGLQQFEEQLVALKQHFPIVPFREALTPGIDGPCAVLTFDDGYFSTLSLAKPLLEEHAIPATVFLATGFLDREWFWWDKLEAIIAEAHGRGRIAEDALQDQLLARWHELRPLVPDRRRHALAALAETLGVEGRISPEDRPLTSTEALRLSSSLIEIGAHTVSHPWLATLPPAAASREIALSALHCREISGGPLAGFAYPFGSWNPDVARRVADAGIGMACTTSPGVAGPYADPLALPRLPVENVGGMQLVERMMQLLAAQSRDAKVPPIRPAVSVIIPLFNKAEYFGECLSAVMAQSFRDFEIVIADDGSTDGSAEIAAAWQRAHPEKIRIVRHPGRVNRGVSQSRNLAIEKSFGRFIAYLDADDTWHPEKLAHDVAILNRHPEAMAVASHAIYWWDDGREEPRIDSFGPDENRVMLPGEYYEMSYVKGTAESPFPSAVTVRRQLTKDVQWDPDFSVAEDLKYLAEIFFRFPVYVSGACLADYRRHENSVWSRSMADGSEAVALERFHAWQKNLTAGN